ncbi:MAG TPA: (2Fe-2S)-binding protein [Acetobacteraceae bacterium]|nr:(2Fe-2S)-binding protein [Acetobacteraceae bacterium]
MATRIAFHVDGVAHDVTVDDPNMPLLYALRDELGLDNPHFGCGLEQCGACTVHVDGVPTRSCTAPVSEIAGTAVTTLAGLGTPEHPHPIQRAFIDEQATFCGYCINGWIMTAVALVAEKPHATEAEIRDGLAGLKCRCGAHMAMIRAVKRVTGAA